MTPLVTTLPGPALQSPARAAAALPAAPAPLPLSAPAMLARVEWSGAVRPPDAPGRTARPEVPVTAREFLLGPTPAFLVNILDDLPDSMAPDPEAEAEPAAQAQADGSTEPGPPEPARAEPPAKAPGGYGGADWPAERQVDLRL